jgi:hypothetical protein
MNQEESGEVEDPRPDDASERGFTTAELLANAALAIIALVAIWAALQRMGIHVVEWIQQQLGM